MTPRPYAGIPNRFRQELLARQRLIGCWCSLANPITTEVLGLAGFDWLLLDAEHAPNDVTTLIPQLMALKDSPSAPVVRPPWNDAVVIKRLLDAGFYNFLIPFVESADEARRAVAATRYPPAGIRGVSVSQRHNRYGTVPDYLADGQRQHRGHGADRKQRRASRPSMPSPRSTASMACSSAPPTWRPRSAISATPAIPRCRRRSATSSSARKAAGKASGILAPVEADARRYIEWGATFVAVGSDLGCSARPRRRCATSSAPRGLSVPTQSSIDLSGAASNEQGRIRRTRHHGHARWPAT